MTLIIHAKHIPEPAPDEPVKVYEDVTCDRCKGEHKIKCEYCDGTGKVWCDKCDGEGQVERLVEITSEEYEARQSEERQKELLRRRYGTDRPASIRYLFFPELEG